jgi:hypothetical protein
MEVAAIVMWHRPNDDGDSGNNEYCSGENITPMEFFHTFLIFLSAKIRKKAHILKKNE